MADVSFKMSFSTSVDSNIQSLGGRGSVTSMQLVIILIIIAALEVL